MILKYDNRKRNLSQTKGPQDLVAGEEKIVTMEAETEVEIVAGAEKEVDLIRGKVMLESHQPLLSQWVKETVGTQLFEEVTVVEALE